MSQKIFRGGPPPYDPPVNTLDVYLFIHKEKIMNKPFKGIVFATKCPTPGQYCDCNTKEGNIITSTVMSVAWIHDNEFLVETRNSIYVLMVTDTGLWF